MTIECDSVTLRNLIGLPNTHARALVWGQSIEHMRLAGSSSLQSSCHSVTLVSDPRRSASCRALDAIHGEPGTTGIAGHNDTMNESKR